MRELHHVYTKFDSVVLMRARTAEELKEQVPDTLSFNLGYYHKSNRMWVATNNDLKSMYLKFTSGEIVLWCDGRTDVRGKS